MAFTLYDATIPSYQQTLAAMVGLLDKAETFIAEHGIAADDILQARVAPDMLPFCYQVKATAEHSLGSIAGVRKGVYSPDLSPPPADFAGLRAKLATAQAELAAIHPAEVNGWIGQDMRFQFGERVMPFTAENFLLSFSLPNFYFHATTAYDLLRGKGVKIGKPDYLGRPRLKL